jgi:surface carbohydrate biosynthesis protein
MNRQKNIYIIIESVPRELDSKLVLAIHSAKSGWRVVIGGKTLLHKLRFEAPGVVLYKDSQAPMKKVFKDLRSLGHYIAVMDEEGLVQHDDESYVRRRVRNGSLRYVDLHLCWGKHQASLISSCIEELNSKGRVYDTGSTRFDLLRQPFVLPESGGPHCILINTKVAEFNHIEGATAYIDALLENRNISTQDEIRRAQQQVEFKKELFERYVRLISKIRETYPNVGIILRPHPSENMNVWKMRLEHVPNITYADRSTSVVDNLLQATLLIHTYCTTAIEAALLKIPAISYEPLPDTTYEEFLPGLVSDRCRDDGAVLSKLAEMVTEVNHSSKHGLSNKCSTQQTTSELNKYVSSLQGRFAYQQQLEAIERETQREGFTFETNPIRQAILVAWQVTRDRFRALSKVSYYTSKFRSSRAHKDEKRDQQVHLKMTSVGDSEFRSRFLKVGNIMDALPAVKYTKMHPGIYEILLNDKSDK